MWNRYNLLSNTFKKIDLVIQLAFRKDPFPKELAFVSQNFISNAPTEKFSIKNIFGDGILLAVPKFRRTIERRWKRKFGSPDYVWKMLVPKNNIRVCNKCGHHYESGVLCANCLMKVEAETKVIQEKVQEALGNGPIEQEVIVLYDGEQIEKPKEEWNGKRIIEMKKPRPACFSKNLMQKTTQQPSDSTDVKPTELA